VSFRRRHQPTRPPHAVNQAGHACTCSRARNAAYATETRDSVVKTEPFSAAHIGTPITLFENAYDSKRWADFAPKPKTGETRCIFPLTKYLA
jgi:hypothetical protein